MYTKIYSATTIGVHAYPVDVEVDLSFGMLQFNIVGLPDIAIKESPVKEFTPRLKIAAIKLPERKITVNLAPADLKEGTVFDLPNNFRDYEWPKSIEIDPAFLQSTLFLGELSLDGTIKPIKGALHYCVSLCP